MVHPSSCSDRPRHATRPDEALLLQVLRDVVVACVDEERHRQTWGLPGRLGHGALAISLTPERAGTTSAVFGLAGFFEEGLFTIA
jgi:hypothetical protein